MAPPRVLYLTDLSSSNKFGSMEEQIFELAKAFKALGGVFVPVFGGEPSARVRGQYASHGLEVEGLNLHEFRASSLRRLFALVRRHGITVAHWNFYSPINPYVWMMSAIAPALSHVRTDHNSRWLPRDRPQVGARRVVKRALFRRYRRVFGISDFVVSAMRTEGIWPAVSRCTYFVNTTRFAPDAAVRAATRAEMSADGKFVVVLVGQLILQKGGQVAIEALRDLPADVEMWMIGDGAERQALVDLAAAMSVSGRVRFLGERWSVEPFMQAADCVICPSIWEEAVGLVNIEAMATGVPVIASRIGGIPEFVTHEHTGLLFPAGDHRALSRLIARLHGDRALARQFGHNAREDAVERFSIERRIPEYVRAYET